MTPILRPALVSLLGIASLVASRIDGARHALAFALRLPGALWRTVRCEWSIRPEDEEERVLRRAADPPVHDPAALDPEPQPCPCGCHRADPATVIGTCPCLQKHPLDADDLALLGKLGVPVVGEGERP